MNPATAQLIQQNLAAKGDVLGVARLAGIMAAKRTWDLIPLSHGLPLTSVDVDFQVDVEAGQVDVFATARTEARTGVEMEALTAVAVAGLTIYDMCKAADRGMVIGEMRLTFKSGGKSGTFMSD
jgi:cyclic pyranopterin phosphate synthase